jgi:hypothetical protein
MLRRVEAGSDGEPPEWFGSDRSPLGVGTLSTYWSSDGFVPSELADAEAGRATISTTTSTSSPAILPAPDTPAARRLPPWLRVALVPVLIACLVVVVALQDGGASPTARSVAAVLVWWTILAAAAFSLAPRHRIPRAAVVCAALLLAFGVFSGLSAWWAPSAERAFGEMDRVLLYAGVFVAALLFTRRGEAGRWADGLALAVAGVGVLALSQRLFPDLLPADDLTRDLPTAATRLTYPLGYWNGLAILLGLGVPLLLRSAVTARLTVWRAAALSPVPVLAAGIYLTSSRGGAAVAVVGGLAFVALAWQRLHALLALVLGAAGSVGAVAVLHAHPALVDGPFGGAGARDAGATAALLIAALCLAVGAVYALLSVRTPARFRVPVVGWIAAAVLLVVAVLVADPAARLRSFKAVPPDTGNTGAVAISAHLTGGGGSGRWQFWGAALDQFSAHPLAGGGAGSYESWWAQHGSIDWFVRNAHSLWLETLGELGMIGLLLLSGTFVVALVAGAARLRVGSGEERTTVAALIAVVIAFVVGSALDWVWQLPVVPIVALAALGLLVGPATAARAGRAETAPPPAADSSAPRPLSPGPLRFGARAALVLVAWLVVVVQAIPFLADQEVGASRRAAARGDIPAAVDHARSAQAVEPWASSPRLQLALAYEELGNNPPARRHLARAIERDSEDWRLRVVDARLAVKAGDIPAARRALARARSLNPRSRLLRLRTR